jgi:hypothetical protein
MGCCGKAKQLRQKKLKETQKLKHTKLAEERLARVRKIQHERREARKQARNFEELASSEGSAAGNLG